MNFTASMPRGLYVTYDCAPKTGDIIQFRPGEDIWRFALERYYVASHTAGFLKKVMATAGDRVCWKDSQIAVNGEIMGRVSATDSRGRLLGHAPECITLGPDQLLPLAPDFEKSYDGRYFGPIRASHIQSCARPLLTFD